ncbi:MAG: hypothetical protein ACRDZ8_06465 [Acidimicrobiales bacterium]
MASWDDTMVENDGDELVDWLWDLPDSYDVGYDDAPPTVAAGVTTVGGATVRKRLRRQGEPAEGGSSVDWPTQGMDAVAFDAGDRSTEFLSAHQPRRKRRFTVNSLGAVAAIVFVLLGIVGLAYALLHNGSSNKIDINASATTTSVVQQQVVVPTVPVTSPTDTTPSTTPTTTADTTPDTTPTDSALPAVTPTATTNPPRTVTTRSPVGTPHQGNTTSPPPATAPPATPPPTPPPTSPPPPPATTAPPTTPTTAHGTPPTSAIPPPPPTTPPPTVATTTVPPTSPT